MGGKDLLIELGPYVALVYTQEESAHKWVAWVTFERYSDHAATKTCIPGVRHLMKGMFPTQSDARTAAVLMAHQKMESGEVGL